MSTGGVPQNVSHDTDDMASPARRRGVSWPALIVGAGLAVLISVGSYASLFVFRSTEPTRTFLPAALGFPFLVVVFVNVVLARVRRWLALTPAELVLIFTMGLVTTGIPIFMYGFQMTLWPAAPYFATPENRWAEILLPHMKQQSWLMPTQSGSAIRWFYEGLPPGQSIPWKAWILPLLWWQSLVWAFYLVCFCLVVIFRKHWVEHERLTFPLMRVGIQLIQPGPGRSVLPAVFRDRVFWIGFMISFGWMALSVASFWSDTPLRRPWNLAYIHIAQGYPAIVLNVSFLVIGFLYFAHRQVSFSIWLFGLLYLLQEGMLNRIGWTLQGKEWMLWQGTASILWQGMGAFTVMVLWSLWMARRHLAQVVRKALGRPSDLNDADEMVSYRTAVLGLLWGLGFMVAYLYYSGMELRALAVFLPTVLLIYLGITIVVIQTGFPYFVPPLIAQPFVYHAFGTASLQPTTITSLGFTYGWHGDVQSVFIAGAAHGAKLRDEIPTSGRWMTIGIVVAVVLASVALTLFFVWLGYHEGAYNIRNRWMTIGRSILAHGPVDKLVNPRPPDPYRWYVFMVGAASTMVLTYLTYRLPWWPIHPIGVAIGAVWTVRYQIFSIFIAWLAKTVIMWLGDTRLYRRLAPLFIGLIAGYFIGTGLGLTVDIIWFPGRGHEF